MGWRRWVGGGRSGRKWAEVGAPNFLLRWHDTEVAIRTSTCKWLKYNYSRPVPPLHWVKKGIFWKIATSARLPPDCRPIAATPNLFLFWHDTEVAMGTSTCIWLKHINLRPVLPLHWVKKGIWWKITLPPTSARLQPDCCPIAARLPPHQVFFFFDTIQRLQWVWVLAHVDDSKTTAYVQCYIYIESKKEFDGKYHFRPIAARLPPARLPPDYRYTHLFSSLTRYIGCNGY